MHFRFPFRPALVIQPRDTFLLESFFLREVVQMLTPTPDEDMVFLSGPKLNRLRVVCRRAPQVPLERQSVVFVRTSGADVAQALIPIIEQGAELHICAHSHPGGGPSATFPSGTDIKCLGKLQRAGSPAIGLIVTRDAHVRFFTVHIPFRVIVTGSGVTKLGEHLFQLQEEQNDETTPVLQPEIHNPAPARPWWWFWPNSISRRLASRQRDDLAKPPGAVQARQIQQKQ